MNIQKPRPSIDHDSKIYWDSAKDNKLMIQRCKNSNEHFLYSRQLTNNINDQDIEWIEASGKGHIYSFTEVNAPAGPAFKEDVPYIVASIELEEGARIIANIIQTQTKKVSIGKKVKVVFEKQSDEFIIPKFILDE